MTDAGRLSRPTTPKVYVFTTPHDKAREWVGPREGVGVVKVGYTTKENVEDRIWQQFPTKTADKQPFEVLLAEPAVTDDGRAFTDKDLHKALKRAGCHNVNGEWFEATLDEIRAAILQVQTGERVDTSRLNQFAPRPEQQAAIDVTSAYFRQYPKERDGKAPHFLWNAKMRFGKTFTAYQLAKEMGWKRILVLTYKPAVKNAWREDLESHVDFADWQFLDADGDFFDLNEERPIVWFASFQDVLGRASDGSIKERNEAIHLEDWDVVILDEYHFGAWRDEAKGLYANEAGRRKEVTASEELEDVGDIVEAGFTEETFPLTASHYLYLSGTPFRALSNGEFTEDQIFNWTYPDEQAAKQAWDPANGPNLYAELPEMVMLTYQLPPAIRAIAEAGDVNEFDLSEFFRATSETVGKGQTAARFKYETAVQGWLDLLRGQYVPEIAHQIVDGVRPPLPFEDARLLDALRHTIWFLPNVASCEAMAELLARPHNRAFYGQYEVVLAAGSHVGTGAAALPPVLEAIANPMRTKTITLTCGKLMTGVTVAPWTGIFMLRSMNSPETYFQSAFRVQSPWALPQVDPTGGESKVIIKDRCYVFDYDPNRALRQVSDYATRLTGATAQTMEQSVADFLHFLPVLCYDGYSLQELKAGELLDIVAAGTASTMLARRWQSARLVNVDNAALARLAADPDLVASLEQIESFRHLSNDVSRVINSEKALDAKKRDKPDMDKQEKKEYDAERTKNNKWRKELRENLLKFLARVPIFMYLTDKREETLVDVIRNQDPALFTRVTGLTVHDFDRLVDLGVFNADAMNAAIFAFRRFEEASLIYAGGRTLNPDDVVGGFTETERRGDIEDRLASGSTVEAKASILGCNL